MRCGTVVWCTRHANQLRLIRHDTHHHLAVQLSARSVVVVVVGLREATRIMANINKLSALYDALYDKGVAALKEYNPCNIRMLEGVVICNGGYSRKDGKINWTMLRSCCAGCKHLGTEGCATKSLSCKVWLCSAVKWGVDSTYSEGAVKANPEIVVTLAQLEQQARNGGIRLGFRQTKAEAIEASHQR